MQRLQPVGPVVEQRQAVASVDLDAQPATEVSGDLEARGVDDAVDLVLVAVGHHASSGDPLDPPGLADVDERDVVPVEAGEVLVVERRALAHLPVVRLQRLGRVGIGDGVGDALADPVHLAEVGQLQHGGALLAGLRPVRPLRRADHVAEDVRPRVVDEVGLDRPAGGHLAEVVAPLALPAGLQRRPPVRVGRLVAPPVDRRRRPLEHVQVSGVLSRPGHALDRGRTGADDRHPLVGQPGHPAGGVATGVVVVPPVGVERVALELVDAGDAGQLGPRRRTERHDDEAGLDVVAAVGRQVPALGRVVPVDGAHPCLEQRLVVQVVALADALGVLEDLRDVRVLLLRHVVQLFEQRQVAVRLDVALRAGIAVPVPRAAEVTTGLDDAKSGDALLGQPRRSEQPTEPATDDGDVDLVIDRIAIESGFDVRIIVRVVGEPAGHLEVLVGTVGAQPLAPLSLVALAQLVWIEAEVVDGRCHLLTVPPLVWRPTNRLVGARPRVKHIRGRSAPTSETHRDIGSLAALAHFVRCGTPPDVEWLGIR